MILFIFDIFVNLKNFATPCPVPDIGTPDHQVPWFDPLLWIVVALDANFAHGGMVRLQQKGPVIGLMKRLRVGNRVGRGWVIGMFRLRCIVRRTIALRST
jgi:hypothetical protein